MAIALWSVETFPQVRGQWRNYGKGALGGHRALECGDISSGERAVA